MSEFVNECERDGADDRSKAVGVSD